jgi:hypothetical protein
MINLVTFTHANSGLRVTQVVCELAPYQICKVTKFAEKHSLTFTFHKLRRVVDVNKRLHDLAQATVVDGVEMLEIVSEALEYDAPSELPTVQDISEMAAAVQSGKVGEDELASALDAIGEERCMIEDLVDEGPESMLVHLLTLCSDEADMAKAFAEIRRLMRD